MKRFELNNGESSEYFTDNDTGRSFWFGEHEDFCEVCELLNDLNELHMDSSDVSSENIEPDVVLEDFEVDLDFINKNSIYKVVDESLGKLERDKERLKSLINGGHEGDFSVDVGLAIIEAKYDCLSHMRSKIEEL